MVNVFMLLIDRNGEPEDIDLGSLYVAHDPSGFIQDITIEPYGSSHLEQYEAHFDKFNPEIPEVPKTVRFSRGGAFICGFFGSEGYEIDLEALQEDPNREYRYRETRRYDLMVRSAYRLYERAVRGEPAFVGYIDHERHSRLSIRDVLEVAPPSRHLSPLERRNALREHRRVEAAKKGKTLQRVFLWADNEISAQFPGELVLDVCTRPDGFPHRFGHVLGVAGKGRPLVIMDDGNLCVGDAKGFFTNLMACKMKPGESIFVWTDHCQKTQIFRIHNTGTIISAENLQETE